MNKDKTKEAIKVMQAYVDGKAIQYRDISLNWVDCGDNPKWQWFLTDYRIKPEPREFTLGLDEDGCIVICGKGVFGISLCGGITDVIKVREVLE